MDADGSSLSPTWTRPEDAEDFCPKKKKESRERERENPGSKETDRKAVQLEGLTWRFFQPCGKCADTHANTHLIE